MGKINSKPDANIAQTGLRSLFILQLLIKEPISKTHILNKIENHSLLKAVTADTITLDINTLKSIGFDIKTGNKGNNYCYELKLNPIKLELTAKELHALVLAKNAAFEFLDYEHIIGLYETLKKVTSLLKNDAKIDKIMNFGNFLNIDFDVLNSLRVHCKNKNKISITYDSPSENKREINVVCHQIMYAKKSDKLHLWCEIEQYNKITYLRVDKILSVNRILEFNSADQKKYSYCKYKIAKIHSAPLEFEKFERVVQITPNFIELEAQYLDEFNLIQRILSFGDTLLSIEDATIKKKVIKALKEIKEVYICEK